jgi:hypothetical protein
MFPPSYFNRRHSLLAEGRSRDMADEIRVVVDEPGLARPSRPL